MYRGHSKNTLDGKVYKLHTYIIPIYLILGFYIVVFTLNFCFLGSELRNWLLFFSLPVLRGILPTQFFSHLAKLVVSIYIYSSDAISEQDFLLGRCLLREFYCDFSTLYGNYIHPHNSIYLSTSMLSAILMLDIRATTMNVHLLSHLPDCVYQWGPLWAYSCFHFENMNGKLKNLFHGTKNMSKQVKLCCSVYLTL